MFFCFFFYAFYTFKLKEKKKTDTNIQPCIRKDIPDRVGQREESSSDLYSESYFGVPHMHIAVSHAKPPKPQSFSFFYFFFLLISFIYDLFFLEHLIALVFTEALKKKGKLIPASFSCPASATTSSFKPHPRPPRRASLLPALGSTECTWSYGRILHTR